MAKHLTVKSLDYDHNPFMRRPAREILLVRIRWDSPREMQSDGQVVDFMYGGEGGIRTPLKSLKGLHRFFKDFRTNTRFSHQNRNFLITLSCSFRVAFCSLPPNKVIARFPWACR